MSILTSNSASKGVKITYWMTTGLLGLFILPGIFFMNSQMALDGMQHLGIPEWLRLEASIGSFLGGLLLVLPLFSPRFKEWAYVAFGIEYISAFIAHLYVDGFGGAAIQALVTFGILLTSYICYHKMIQK